MSASLVELAIVGGGATGLAAAIQAASDGLRVVLLERGSPGGRIRERDRVEVVPGLPVGPSGAELTLQAVETAIRLGAQLRSDAEVTRLGIHGPEKHLRLADGTVVRARSVIAATGADQPVLSIPGLREFTGRGVYFGVPFTLPEHLRGEEVWIAGEPVAAMAAALALSGHCGEVTVISEGGRVSPRVDAELRRRSGITERPHCEVVEAVGVERLEALVLRDRRSGRTRVRNAAALFLLGIDRPRTAWLATSVTLDVRGYVLTGRAARESGIVAGCGAPPLDAGLESSQPGVFAAGGVRGSRDCCAESVGGEGACAARQVLRHLRGAVRPADSTSAGHG